MRRGGEGGKIRKDLVGRHFLTIQIKKKNKFESRHKY